MSVDAWARHKLAALNKRATPERAVVRGALTENRTARCRLRADINARCFAITAPRACFASVLRWQYAARDAQNAASFPRSTARLTVRNKSFDMTVFRARETAIPLMPAPPTTSVLAQRA